MKYLVLAASLILISNLQAEIIQVPKISHYHPQKQEKTEQEKRLDQIEANQLEIVKSLEEIAARLNSDEPQTTQNEQTSKLVITKELPEFKPSSPLSLQEIANSYHGETVYIKPATVSAAIRHITKDHGYLTPDQLKGLSYDTLLKIHSICHNQPSLLAGYTSQSISSTAKDRSRASYPATISNGKVYWRVGRTNWNMPYIGSRYSSSSGRWTYDNGRVYDNSGVSYQQSIQIQLPSYNCSNGNCFKPF